MNNDDLARWLRENWRRESETVEGQDPEVDRLVNSSLVSVRFAVLTQLLGVLADSSRDVLCLQRGDIEDAEGAGRWDARSLCTRVVIPWNQENQNVLGGSTDPYVNNPLRRPRLDEQETSLKKRADWDALVSFLRDATAGADGSEIVDSALRCLKSIARRLHGHVVHYAVPPRVSLAQVADILESYLTPPSRGLRALAAATALLKVIGSSLGLFGVSSQGLNEPDSATDAPGDIVCSANGKPVLVAEVKDRSLSLVDFEASLDKARKRGVPTLVFFVPRLSDKDEKAIQERIAAVWAQGTNVYTTTLLDLARISFMLVEEHWRHEVLAELGGELNRRNAPYSHHRAFADLLEALDTSSGVEAR